MMPSLPSSANHCHRPKQQLRSPRFAMVAATFTTALVVTVFAHNPAFGQFSAQIAADQAKLDQLPFEAEALGLRINLPVGSTVMAERSGGQVSLAISDDPKGPSWTMRVQRLIPSIPNPTAAGLIDDFLRERRAKHEPMEIISNAAFMAGGAVGQLCFVKMTANPQHPYISGWLLVPTDEAAFLAFLINTLPEHMPRVRPLLEASFATLRVRSAEAIAAERQALLDSGLQFIQSVTPEQLRTHVGVSEWYRIYKPSDAGAQEVGYSLLEVVEAPRGALDPNKPTENYDAGERTPGIMIRAQGRLVANAERGVYYDSIALYWMSWDQSEEAWTIRGTHRQGDAERSEAETGVRTPLYASGAVPNPELTVIKSDNFRNTRDAHAWPVPQVYLSQPLHWLLGRLMPKDIQLERPFAYYFYNFATGQLSLRNDTWGPTNDGTGHYRLTTRMTSDAPAVTAIYNDAGDLVRRIHPDGSITEPTPVDAIHKLWTAQGLNTGRARR